eukprot:2259247-Prymnesium_polylepis.1
MVAPTQVVGLGRARHAGRRRHAVNARTRWLTARAVRAAQQRTRARHHALAEQRHAVTGDPVPSTQYPVPST